MEEMKKVKALFWMILALLMIGLPVSVQAGAKTITGFADENAVSLELSEKEPESEVIGKLPETIAVYVNGSTAPVEIPVSWETEMDYANSGQGYYIYFAVWDEDAYAIDPSYNPEGFYPFAEVTVLSECADSGISAQSGTSAGVENIVARARQQVDIAWTPLKNVKGYTDSSGKLTGTYTANRTYTGIPYGQQVSSGKYVPHDATFNDFLNSVKSSSSVFYTQRGKYGVRDSTYYANDCSAFVSYCYGLPRMTTAIIAKSSYFTQVSGNSLQNAQIGDCINRGSYHVRLITDIVYGSNGKPAYIEVSEQTPPKAKTQIYTVSELQTNINANGYKILRFKNRDSVKAPDSYSGYTSTAISTAKIADAGADFYAYLYCTESGLYVTNRGNVELQSAGNIGNQIWHFVRQSNGSYKITSTVDGKLLYTNGGSTSSGTNVLVSGSGKTWYLYAGGGKYSLKTGSAFLSVSGTAATAKAGNNIALASSNSGAGQKFQIQIISSAVASQDGTKRITPALSFASGTVTKTYGDGTFTNALKAPSGAAVTWTCSNASVASVDTTGKVTILSAGTAVITAKVAQDSTYSAASLSYQLTIVEKELSGCDADQIEEQLYTGEEICPKVNVRDGEALLIEGRDYTVTYQNNVKPGMAKILLTGTGNYQGTLLQTFMISHEHEWDEGTVTEEPDCVREGLRVYTCRSCGETREESIAALGHQAVTDEALEPTEVSAGKTEGSHCSVCGEILEAQQILPITGYDWDEGVVTKEPTCTEEGEIVFTAVIETANSVENTEKEDISDGQTEETGEEQSSEEALTEEALTEEETVQTITETEILPALGHHAVRDPRTEVNCTEDGKTEGSHCDRCGEVLIPQETIEATGHDWDEGVVTVQATTLKAGTIVYTCKNCGETRQETVEKLLLQTPVLGTYSCDAKGVTINWKAVQNASYYGVYRKTASSGWSLIGTTAAASYQDTAAKAGTTYTYTIRCMADDKKTPVSLYDKNGITISYLQTPALKALTIKESSVVVQWSAVKGTGKYRVFRKTGSGSWTKLADVTSTNYTDKTAKSGTTYTYTVRCVDAKGKFVSGYNSAGKKTVFLTAPTVTVKNAAGGIVVSWKKITGAKGYYIYRKTPTGSWKKIATKSSGNTVTHTDSTVKNSDGKTYLYTVRAYTGSTLSAYRPGVTTVRLKAVAISSATNSASKKITVKWNKYSGAGGYQIQYATSSSFNDAKASTITSNKTGSRTLEGLTKGKTYYIRLRAFKKVSGKSYYSMWSSTKKVKVSK